MRMPAICAALTLALTPGLAGCGGGGGGGGDASIHYDSLTPLEPTAGTWQTWIVADVPALRPPAPSDSDSDATALELDALHARALARTEIEEERIEFWNGGTARRWNELQLSLIALRSVSPPKAARGLALVSMAMYDAMVCAWDAKFAWLRARPSTLDPTLPIHGVQPDVPSYVSERAAMSAAAAAVLHYLFPDPADAATIDALLLDAQDADLDACIQFPSDVAAGVALGGAVGAQVLAHAATDHGDDPQPAYVVSPVAGHWEPTPPGNVQPPLLPGWGVVLTFLMESGQALRPGPPPVYGSAEWNLQVQEVLDVSQTLTQERMDIADFWADGPGTVTPPGHWDRIALDKAVAAGLNECRMARMLAALGAAQHDAFVSCWECKYFYDVERPITSIRDLGAPWDTWLSYVTTPPFPSYPSGHSSTSGAASQVLGYLFPQDATELAMLANEAKDSRLYGGIHFTFDNDVGLSLGHAVGTLAIARLAADGAP